MKKEDIRNALCRIRKKGDVDVARNTVFHDIIPELVDRLDEDSNICDDDDSNGTEKRNLVGQKDQLKRIYLISRKGRRKLSSSFVRDQAYPF